MATRKQLPSKSITLVYLLLFLLSSCSFSQGTNPVRLDEFKEGIPFSERIRLKVKDIVVGETSVKHLFKPIEQKEASWWEYYSGKTNKLNLVINNGKDLEGLRVTLAAQPKDNNRLKVILQDDQDTILRNIWGLKDRFNRTAEISIAITPCDEITHILYTSINSIIKEQLQKGGGTSKSIDLNQLFDMLLRNEIDPYIANLDAIKKDDPCFRTFQLLKWLRGDEVSGFDSGEYDLNAGLQGLLQPAIDALLNVRSNWSQYNLNVMVVGYTDPIAVKTEIELRLDKTGITDWGNIENPLDIRYDGCSNERLDSKKPIYINHASEAERQIKQKIINNCELGAVRAYVAMVYLMNKLGRTGIEYSYATGGVYSYPNDNSKNEDPKKRKVNIEFTTKAAREDKRKS